MEPSAIRRRQHAALCGHLGDEAGARSLLHDPDGAVRATALAALGRMDSLTTDDLSRALLDPDHVVRRRACALTVPFLQVDLVKHLDDGDPVVTEQAAWALGERGENAGRTAVIQLSRIATKHDDALCREAAVAALGAIGDSAGLSAILQATTDKPAIRRRAVIALAPFDGPEVDEALRRALSDRDWQVRQAAEDIGGESATPA